MTNPKIIAQQVRAHDQLLSSSPRRISAIGALCLDLYLIDTGMIKEDNVLECIAVYLMFSSNS